MKKKILLHFYHRQINSVPDDILKGECLANINKDAYFLNWMINVQALLMSQIKWI